MRLKKANKESSTRENQRKKRCKSFCKFFTNFGHQNPGSGLDPYPYQMKRYGSEKLQEIQQYQRKNKRVKRRSHPGYIDPAPVLAGNSLQCGLQIPTLLTFISVEERQELTLATLILPLCLQATVSSVASRSPHFSHSSVQKRGRYSPWLH